MRYENLKRAADLCLNSYSTVVLPEGMDCTCMITVGTDDVYLFHDKSSVWLVIRGTEWTLREWYYDFTLLKTKVKGMGRVHRGFYKNIPELWKRLVKEKGFNSHDIHITGHSRGGDLAQLLALKHKLSFDSDPKVYTFGSPRVGNRAWVKAYGSIKTIRVNHIFDIVPKTPSINYWHTGKSLWIVKTLRKHSMLGYFLSVSNL